MVVRRRAGIALLLALCLASLPGGVLADRIVGRPPAESRPVYVRATGFWLDADVAAFWQRRGGESALGNPISRVFYQDGYHRQYFERAVVEKHENLTGSGRVQLADVGSMVAAGRRWSEPPFIPRAFDPVRDRDQTYFAATGHAVDWVFQTWWERQGGLERFGYPLSAAFLERVGPGGAARLVQYFERARLEYAPGQGDTSEAIALGALGVEALALRAVPELALTPQAETATERDAPPLGPLAVGGPSPVGCGFNFAFWGRPEDAWANVHYLDMAAATGCEWVRLQFAWSDLEPARDTNLEDRIWWYAHVVELARERGLRVLVDVTHAPDWARTRAHHIPADPAAFASFLSRLVTRFAGQVDAWQIWNEPNLIDETNGRISPAGFLELLRAAYPAVKQADPHALVVFPGLAPTSLMYDDWAMDDDWYLATFLSLNHGEGARYFDVLGVQGYGAGNDPDTYFPGNLADNPAWVDHPEFYFRHVEQLHAVLVDAGFGAKPLWITEMGWPVGRQADVYGYGEWVTRELQAAYLTRAYEIMRTEWHWVENAIVWHLNAAGYGDPGNPFSGFSVTEADGTPRPAYEAIVSMTRTWRAEAAP